MSVRPINPAGELANVQALLARVAALEEQLAQVRERNYGRRAQITAYSGGTQMTVTFATGGTAQCRYLQSYTPVVGHWGLVICTPEYNWWAGRDSVP